MKSCPRSRANDRRAANFAGVIAMAFSFIAIAHGDPILQFNRDIRPILSESCFACHGPDPGSRKAGMRLDTRQGLFGPTKKEGTVVTPGDAEKSALWTRISSGDPEEVMPPPESHKILKAQQKEIIRKWIIQGAPWQPNWSFIEPEQAPLPAVRYSQWVRNPIDAFVLSRLELKGLAPAPEANRRTLARRLSLDLRGLPPTTREVDAFVHDDSPDAYEHLVDQLLDSPAWGEHRARYWLDVARYADTHGYHFDNYREMWPYRDWVIAAFNRNLPFDRFSVEQIAGDLLPDASPDELIATGFHRCNMTTNEGGTIEDENLANYDNDRVTTTSWVWLGLTANCASCHDHKFDPISTRDFYSMAAYFRNTTQPGFDGNVKDSKPSLVVPQSAEDQARWEALPREMTAQNQRIEQRREVAKDSFKTWLASNPTTERVPELNGPGLLVHLPLNEGAGDEVKGLVSKPTVLKTAGKLSWKSGGKLGAAPLLKKDTTFDAGNVCDFERDQAFSYGGWVNVPSGGRFEAVLARMDQDNNFRGWDLFIQDRNCAIHLVNRWPENALKVATENNPIRPGEWQHIFATYDGSGKAEGVRIYVDGTEARLKSRPTN